MSFVVGSELEAPQVVALGRWAVEVEAMTPLAGSLIFRSHCLDPKCPLCSLVILGFWSYTEKEMASDIYRQPPGDGGLWVIAQRPWPEFHKLARTEGRDAMWHACRIIAEQIGYQLYLWVFLFLFCFVFLIKIQLNLSLAIFIKDK